MENNAAMNNLNGLVLLVLRESTAPLSLSEIRTNLIANHGITEYEKLEYDVAVAVLDLLNNKVVRMVRYGNNIHYWLLTSKEA